MRWRPARDLLASIIIAGVLYAGCLIPAAAQNVICPDRPAGDNTFACANTRFVSGGLVPIVVGTTPIIGGSSTGVLYNNSGILGADAGHTWVPGGPLTISPTASSLTQGIVINQSVSGTWPGGTPGRLSFINVTSDNSVLADASQVATPLFIQYLFSGGKGSRSGIYVKVIPNGPTIAGDFETDVIGMTGFVNTNVAQTGPVARSLFGMSPSCRLDNGATGYQACLGAEVDVGINTGAGANFLVGWNVVNVGTAQATTRSVAYSVSGANATPGFQFGLLFTNQNGSSPFATTATLLSADYSQTVATGIDWSLLTFTKVFNFANSSLDNSGNWASNGSYTSNSASGGFINNDGGGGTAVLSSNNTFAAHAANVGNVGNFPLVFFTNNAERGRISNAGVWNIGLTGTLTGQMGFSGATSGTATITAQATAGSPTLTLPNTSGTLPSTVTNETNVTLSLNTTTGLITPGWTGTLSTSRGGTGSANGAFIKAKITKFTANGTYTPTTGALYTQFECVGGGAGGGATTGSATGGRAGGGGGGGGYSRVMVASSSQTITIGGGGNGGSAGNNAGSVGADTTVGSLCTGKGGTGGNFNDGSTGFGEPGAGGVAGTGDFTPVGVAGLGGATETITTVVVASGTGGWTPFGGGAKAQLAASGSNNAGNAAAANTGGGGSGAATNGTATNAAGGNGGSGYVVVTEFLNQ
jgi:hypothetical protein